MSDWDDSDGETKQVIEPAVGQVSASKKFADEDVEEVVDDDWDASSADETKPTNTSQQQQQQPKKKKLTGLKAKIAEKEAERLAALSKDPNSKQSIENLDVLDWAEKKRLLRQKEIDSDLASASDLLSVNDNQNFKTLSDLANSNPQTLSDFTNISNQLISILQNFKSKPLYPKFLSDHIYSLASNTLTQDSDIKSISSKLNALSNERARAIKKGSNSSSGAAAATGGKKGVSAKPTLGALGSGSGIYKEALDDDFISGDYDDDFM